MIPLRLRSIVSEALLAATLVPIAMLSVAVLLPVQKAAAQTAADAPMQISWEVRNRFRLFREERDFLLHAESVRDRNVLASEQALELQSDGRGWARNMVNRLCINMQGRVSEPCMRDNVQESYLTPADHAIVVRLTGAVPVGATCAWSFDDGEGPRQQTFDCAEPVNLRVRYGRPTVTTVDVSSGAETQRVSTEIRVRDILIAGLGDSIASGEGNPDRPIALSDEGFCFRYYLGSAAAQYYRPSRGSYKGGRACEAPDSLQNWQRYAALWLNPACHRSLYSYQTRTAITLSVRYPHIAVTYLPLACTGATIADGLFGSQRARECPPSKSNATCQVSVNGQLDELRDALTAARRRQPDRQLDLVLLSIGANDIYFSGLVADVIVDTATLRRHRLPRRFALGADARPAARLQQAARGAEAAARRRPVARRLCVLRQSRPREWRRALPWRPRRLRHSSLLQRQSAAAVECRCLCRERVPAAAQGAGAVSARCVVPRSRGRSDDLRGEPSGRLRQPRLLRAQRSRSAVRSRMLLAQGRELRSRHRDLRQPADAVRPQRRRVPPLSAARALDQGRQ
jgi:hypothetical protein